MYNEIVARDREGFIQRFLNPTGHVEVPLIVWRAAIFTETFIIVKTVHNVH